MQAYTSSLVICEFKGFWFNSDWYVAACSTLKVPCQMILCYGSHQQSRKRWWPCHEGYEGRPTPRKLHRAQSYKIKRWGPDTTHCCQSMGAESRWPQKKLIQNTSTNHPQYLDHPLAWRLCKLPVRHFLWPEISPFLTTTVQLETGPTFCQPCFQGPNQTCQNNHHAEMQHSIENIRNSLYLEGRLGVCLCHHRLSKAVHRPHSGAERLTVYRAKEMETEGERGAETVVFRPIVISCMQRVVLSYNHAWVSNHLMLDAPCSHSLKRSLNANKASLNRLSRSALDASCVHLVSRKKRSILCQSMPNKKTSMNKFWKSSK